MRRLLVVLLAVLLCAAATPALGQQGTADIRGKIMDEQGAVLPGVAVVVTNEETGTIRETVSGADGTFSMAQMTPSRYRISAKLEGFQSAEQRGLVLQVGTTLPVNLTLRVGSFQEAVTVTGEALLLDTSSAKVGGNIATAELTDTPMPNRNYFAMVALLPGVQFSPSNQMGNDTMISGGQSSQGNNVTLDGGYNSDDTLGSSSGAQTRTAIESIQEFQVLTGQYDAEFGRAAGAVINAVTKQGTNQFKGVLFGYFNSNALTAQDVLSKAQGAAKAVSTKREWGGVFGGPIVKNKAHFFFSLERQVDNPTRTRLYPTRPELSFAVVEYRSDWNTLYRFDHQISPNHSWAVRYLRESAPQFPRISGNQTTTSFSDETDLDQTFVASYTAVVASSKVNTFRLGVTEELYEHHSPCTRANDFKLEECPPTLTHLSFNTQQNNEATGPRDQNVQLEDTFSWYVPGKKGNHDIKVGFRHHWTKTGNRVGTDLNGNFSFSTDLPFDKANPRTYPERLSIRVPAAWDFDLESTALETFVQDKWQVNKDLMLSIGVRYDLENIKMAEVDNPLFASANDWPVDKNNVSPRIGFSYAPGEKQTVFRGGYGMFYGKSIMGAVDDAIQYSKNSTSFVAQFPQDSADPGPSRGAFPTNPMLVNGPFLNRAQLNALYPPGSTLRSSDIVVWDSPDRTQPYLHQITGGVQHQFGPTLSVGIDYVRSIGRDQFLWYNLNPMVRANTSRTGPITRVNAFGKLDDVYKSQVWVMSNDGRTAYDALNIGVEKRMSKGWSGRVAYSLSSSRGHAQQANAKNQLQVLTDLNMDANWGPLPADRKHVLSMAGRLEIPKAFGAMVSGTVRYMSGSPFTIMDTSIDANQNGELFDPLPAGTYSGVGAFAMTDVENAGGVNGARGPDSFQVDLRVAWRLKLKGSQDLELTVDTLNLTNRANFENPAGDRRIPSTFLINNVLRGGSGFPRQAQLGVRFAF